MAYSFIDYNNLTSAQQNGTFTPSTLQFVEPDDIYMSITVAATATSTILTSNQFTVTTSPSLVVQITDSSLLPLSALDTVRVGRATDIDDLARTFADGSVLKASDLNTQNNQFLFSIQEALDTGSSSLPIGPDNKYDAGGRGIKNVGLPSNDKDAVTLEYVTALQLYNGAALPQAWYFTSGPLTNAGNDRTYTLQSPTPATAIDNMFLVEVQGVMQRPGTDYTVTELNDVYTLRLIGAAQGQTGGFPDGTPVTVRNFGASRNVLVDPFRAGGTTDSALRIERIANQTGDLINARAENNGSVLFRVSASGALLIGAGAVNETTTTYINSNQIEVGDVDQSNWQKYGFLAANTAGKAKVEIQGSNPATTDVALQVLDGDGSGTVFVPFKVTYGGAITANGTLTAPIISTTTLFVSGGVPGAPAASIEGGNLKINNAYALQVGTNEMNITRDTISGLDKILLEPWNGQASTDRNFGIKTPGAPGSIIMNDEGQTFIGFGGDGTGVPHGGQGSIHFTYTPTGESRYGPTMQWERANINVRGYNIPADQNGVSGQDGNQPAFIHYAEQAARDTPLASLNDGDLVCKKQAVNGIPAGYGMWNPNWSATGLADNQYHNVVISRNIVDYDPLAEFAFRSNGGPSGTQSGIYVTAGQWIVRARGTVRSRPGTNNTSYFIASLKAKLQMGTNTAYQHFNEQDLRFNTTNYPSYTEADFDLTIKLIAGDTVLDVASLWILSNASLGSFVEIQVQNCYISVEKVGP